MEKTIEFNHTLAISNCSLADADAILALYDAASDLQTQKNMVVWPKFERSLVISELEEGRQWKLTIDDQIACNWATTFQDREIWGDLDKNDSVFIHRIATHPSFRGNRFIHSIVAWARQYARAAGKKYVRLDTLGENTRLITHYKSAGFTFLGIYKLADTRNLPAHYQKEPNCCLFEMTTSAVQTA